MLALYHTRTNKGHKVTQHEVDILDEKLQEVQAEITRLETIRREVEALGPSGGR